MTIGYNLVISVVLLFLPTNIPSQRKLYRFILFSTALSISLSLFDQAIIPVYRWLLHSILQLVLGSIQICRFKQFPKLYARLADYRIHSGPLYYYIAFVQALECADVSCPVRNISFLALVLVFVAVLFRPKPNTLNRRRMHGTCMSISYLLVCLQTYVLWNLCFNPFIDSDALSNAYLNNSK